jgi:hypothetical protein
MIKELVYLMLLLLFVAENEICTQWRTATSITA